MPRESIGCLCAGYAQASSGGEHVWPLELPQHTVQVSEQVGSGSSPAQAHAGCGLEARHERTRGHTMTRDVDDVRQERAIDEDGVNQITANLARGQRARTQF